MPYLGGGSGQQIIFILLDKFINDQEILMVSIKNPKKPLDFFIFISGFFPSKSYLLKTQRIFFPSGSFCWYCVGSNKKAAKFGGQLICLTRINEG